MDGCQCIECRAISGILLQEMATDVREPKAEIENGDNTRPSVRNRTECQRQTLTPLQAYLIFSIGELSYATVC